MQFRLRLWPTLGTLIGLSLLMSLGTWQFSRYQHKNELEQLRDDRLDAAPKVAASVEELPDNFTRVEIEGQLDQDHLFLFKHRTDDGKPGGWLGAVFRLEEGGAVLVNLGWVHRENYDRLSHDLLERYTPPLNGLFHQPARMVADDALRARLSNADALPDGELVELDSYDLEGLQRAYDAPMPDVPSIVVLGPDHAKQPFPRASFEHVTQPYLTAERHLSYAVFWYVTGLALLGMYLAYGFGYLGQVMERKRGT
ncbi:MAG: SURF1 family protein [Myxococcota bacterium]